MKTENQKLCVTRREIALQKPQPQVQKDLESLKVDCSFGELMESPFGPLNRETEEQDKPERFQIDNEEKASWVARKIREARMCQERVKEWAQKEVLRGEREEQWLQRRFGNELQIWLRAELQRRSSRQRSIALPGGTVALRRIPESLQVLDETELFEWCRKHLIEAVCVTVQASGAIALQLLKWQAQHDGAHAKSRMSRSTMIGHFRQTGEVPEGVASVAAEDRLYVK